MIGNPFGSAVDVDAWGALKGRAARAAWVCDRVELGLGLAWLGYEGWGFDDEVVGREAWSGRSGCVCELGRLFSVCRLVWRIGSPD